MHRPELSLSWVNNRDQSSEVVDIPWTVKFFRALHEKQSGLLSNLNSESFLKLLLGLLYLRLGLEMIQVRYYTYASREGVVLHDSQRFKGLHLKP